LDPDSAIDMTGLCMVLGLIGFFIGTSLAPMAENPPELIPSIGILELLVQAVTFVAIAYIAVGYPYWRDLRLATARLGIVAPDLRTIGIAVVATFACFLVAGIAGFASQQLDPGGGGIDPVQSLRNLGHAQVEEGSEGELLGGIRIIGAAEVEDALSGACLKYMLDSPDRCAATPSGGGSPAEA